MTTNTHSDQMALWTRHTLTGVIGNWRGPRVPRGLGMNAGADGVKSAARRALPDAGRPLQTVRRASPRKGSKVPDCLR